jgi:hypothetical protein
MAKRANIISNSDGMMTPYAELSEESLIALQNSDLPDSEKLKVNQALDAKSMPFGEEEFSAEFKAASSFNKAQRTAFVNAAIKAGMPIEYVNSICPPKISNKTTSLINKAKEVYSSDISFQTKNTVIASLIKEAKLSPESRDEFIDYWNNVLGYQDKDFWPLVAKDYTQEGK